MCGVSTVIPANAANLFAIGGHNAQRDFRLLARMGALKDQLGLTLSSQKGPVEVIVPGHIEYPSEN